jgi:hypothetical protein
VFFSILLDVVVALYILRRQRKIRPVPRALSLRLPVALGVIGLVEVLSYTDTHHVGGDAYGWVLGTLVVGAVLLGAVRALTVRIWTSNNWVVRQGTWLTMGLWAASLGLHFISGVGAKHVDAGSLEATSFLLYLGMTYGVQNAVVHRRATPLWDALGPDAGQRLQINFGHGPGDSGAFFATFRGGGPGFGPVTRNTPQDDPTIIDAEVVDDDEGPAELR